MNHEDEIDHQEHAAVDVMISEDREDIILCQMAEVPGFDDMHILFNLVDEDEVDHQINYHADSVPEAYRHLANITRRLMAALQVIQDEKNKKYLEDLKRGISYL